MRGKNDKKNRQKSQKEHRKNGKEREKKEIKKSKKAAKNEQNHNKKGREISTFFDYFYRKLRLKKRLCDAHFETSKFGQTSQTTNATIARIALFMEVVNHTVTVVGTHRN